MSIKKLSIHTLRYYENYGLFKGKTDDAIKPNRYKHYDESLVEKIEIIKEAKEVGFTLSEIKNLSESGYSNQLSEKKVAVVNLKVEEINAKIRQLDHVKKMLKAIIKDIEKGEC